MCESLRIMISRKGGKLELVCELRLWRVGRYLLKLMIDVEERDKLRVALESWMTKCDGRKLLLRLHSLSIN